ncbi:nitrous oxide reductase regulatory protein NosR [Bradyrhizobium sp. ORS 375]|uniref:NosR/NirI family protein n=1 Tax=Bradyrhizobium sp. (strain ORS 375) TaxID=566679 RepID=UPI0002408A98|nr:NosR/NirI family protein [Bradyrhizobium sp. ORS 375]CCD90353.1 nitrous oxide reductase regulatory protein NosR [Bradyrhizobium sp. ORS 375]
MAAAIMAVIIALCVIAAPRTAHAAGDLANYLSKVTPGEVFPEADRFGAPQGEPPIAPVYRGEQLRGYVYLNSDFANSVGYSGKPIHILVGIDPKGVITGLKLVDHKEPIVLIGIPEPRIVAALNGLLGKDMTPIAQGAEHAPQADIVSGATVTVLVMHDSIVRGAMRLIRSGRIGASGATAAAAQPSVVKSIDPDKGEIRDWSTLLGDGSVRRLHLSIGDVNDAFEKSGNAAAAQNPEPGSADDTFIDLYVALASVPTIGRSLLGDDGYQRLKARLQPGQQAIIVAGDGAYSFKGSAYVRGGIFDRIEVLQEGASTRFRDKNHMRLGSLEAAGAPALREIGLFVTPPEFTLDPTEPWQLQLLVQRTTGNRDKAFLTFDINYILPNTYLKRETRAAAPAAKAPAAAPAPATTTPAPADETEEPLWMRIWRTQTVNIGITAFALAVLTGIFFFQNVLVRRPQLYTWVRRAYLLFVLVWLGWYANAQLSVVNVVTFTNSLLTGFHWEFFLAAPLIFILWAATAAGLLFWGRGPFCGWLCPFGALQELTNTVAKWLKVPQITVPWGLHERLWPIKYIIFLGLFGLSLYSVALAEQVAEVEPFKTAIILKFARSWPFVLYAVALLGIGLFIERFFCRYLCPLGAALAIPGRIRTFEWLRRWKECGSPCQRCAKECPVQSIHPEGHINVNECIYCMHCQELYYDDHRCPHMIQVRLKREKFEAMSSPSMRAAKTGPKTLITHAGQPLTPPAESHDPNRPS